MKLTSALLIVFSFATLAAAQNEQAPIVERDINYENWTYKSVRTGDKINLRNIAGDKKLVLVVYYAPWCRNWQHDVPMLKRFSEKYKEHGLGIIAVGEYDTVAAMRHNLDEMNIPFQAVYESENRADREKTTHYKYRRATGDTRPWGSPWYIFIDPSRIEKSGDTLLMRTHIVNGEIIETEGEAFIREKLKPEDKKGAKP